MAKVNLTLETLKDFDQGSIALAFNQAVKKVLDDLRDRPGLKAARKLSIELTIKPTTEPDRYEVEAKVKDNVPAKSVTRPIHNGATGLVFSSDAPENPAQNTIPMEDD